MGEDPARGPAAPGGPGGLGAVGGPGSPGGVLRDERLGGFAPGGVWDGCRPGPELAAVVAEVAGPGWRCPGAGPGELTGVLRRVAALESWAAAAKLAVVRELIRRDDPPVPGRTWHGDLPDQWSDSLTHEVALALASSAGSAEHTALTAWELGARLPGIAALLADGTLSYAKARLIAETFALLGDADAARAEALLIPQLTGTTGKTYGQISNLANRIAAQVDPGLAERRRTAAVRHGSRVQLFRESSGAAALCGRDLPPDEALAANANVAARALEYKDSGAFPGARMDQLRAAAYLDLINGRTAAARIALGYLSSGPEDTDTDADFPDMGPDADEEPSSGPAPAHRDHGDGHDGDDHGDGAPGGGEPSAGESGDEPGDHEPGGGVPGAGGPGGDGHDGDQLDDDEPGDSEFGGGRPPGGSGHGGGAPGGGEPGDDESGGRESGGQPPSGNGPRRGGPGSGPGGGDVSGQADRRPVLTDLVIPLATLLGLAARPGEAHGLGVLDPGLCRDLAALAAASPHSRFCLTVTDAGGIAIGHGCARPGHFPGKPPPPPRAIPAQVNLTITTDRLSAMLPAAPGSPAPGSPRQPGRQAATGWALAWAGRAGPGRARGSRGDPDSRGDPAWCGTWTLTLPGGRQLTVRIGPVPTETCDHRYESHGYQPSDTLRHLVQVRDRVCTFPSCSRHAKDSDFEHARPYDQGGRTCSCNAGARSRKCHRIKQSPGWNVTQTRPAWHVWTTPSGRTYTQGPYQYPV